MRFFSRNQKAQILNKSLLSQEDLEYIRIFATTVIRGSDNTEMTGFLLELDWQNNQVKKKIAIPINTSYPFWNKRGGNRGGRGVFARKGTLYVATALSVLKFDRELNQIDEITHPYLAGLHEIYVDQEGIWLTSTVHDLIIKLDFNGNIIDEWWGSESNKLQQAFNFSGRNLNLMLEFPKKDFISEYEKYCQEERLHINTVWSHKKEVYILANKQKAFVKIRPKPEQIILQDYDLKSPHNGITTQDNRIIINDTRNQCIRIYDLSGKRIKTLVTSIYQNNGQLSQQFAKAGWQRGLAQADRSIYLVGTSPATVFEVDINKGAVGQICRIDDDVKHCIHGLTATYEL